MNHILNRIKLSRFSLTLLLLIGVFLGASAWLSPLTAHAQGAGPTCPPEFVKCVPASEFGPANDYSNILNLLRALAGPLTPVVIGMLVSTLSENWKWFQKRTDTDKRVLSSIAGAVLALGSYYLLVWLQTLAPSVLDQVQTAFTIAFTSITGVLGTMIYHAVVNKPLEQ